MESIEEATKFYEKTTGLGKDFYNDSSYFSLK